MRILLVFDDGDLRLSNGLKSNLKREFFEVDIISQETKAMHLAKTGCYDLVIIKSLETCEKMRSYNVSTPIISICVDNESISRIAMLRAGADDCLSSIYSYEELVSRIHAVLRRPRLLYSKALNIGDISLDINNHVVTRQNHKINLTRKEFMLLEYLMRNAGSVVSRGQILEHVWDMNADPFSNTIESHILSLRKKISYNSDEAALIQTISGRGYKLDHEV